jgi:hypothetical protein
LSSVSFLIVSQTSSTNSPKADDAAYVELSDVRDEYDVDFERERERERMKLVEVRSSYCKPFLDIVVRYRSSFTR